LGKGKKSAETKKETRKVFAAEKGGVLRTRKRRRQSCPRGK